MFKALSLLLSTIGGGVFGAFIMIHFLVDSISYTMVINNVPETTDNLIFFILGFLNSLMLMHAWAKDDANQAFEEEEEEETGVIQ
ncbi:hypothetical protein [Acinetobacter sp.]|uniref:hypothetical protein n=1 Tax=Acinetobacter sp. TaxID=472 RepID=UPI003D04B191